MSEFICITRICSDIKWLFLQDVLLSKYFRINITLSVGIRTATFFRYLLFCYVQTLELGLNWNYIRLRIICGNDSENIHRPIDFKRRPIVSILMQNLGRNVKFLRFWYVRCKKARKNPGIYIYVQHMLFDYFISL